MAEHVRSSKISSLDSSKIIQFRKRRIWNCINFYWNCRILIGFRKAEFSFKRILFVFKISIFEFSNIIRLPRGLIFEYSKTIEKHGAKVFGYHDFFVEKKLVVSNNIIVLSAV